MTFAPLKTDKSVLKATLKHHVTQGIFPLQLEKKYASKELYLLWKNSSVLDMNLETYMLLIDNQPVSLEY